MDDSSHRETADPPRGARRHSAPGVFARRIDDGKVLPADGGRDRHRGGPRDASGPANFLLRYDAKPDQLAGAVAKHFMGATLQCAQCHDHMFAPWKQDDFRGLAAFFSRLKMMNSDDGTLQAVIESRRGEMQIVQMGAKPAEDGTIPMTTVMPRLPITGAAPLAAQAPRRQTLAAWLTAPENPWFARHAVNSTWHQLFGMPLVKSLDDPEAALRSEHGDVLDFLSDDFVEGGYDVKRLIRILVGSRAYRAPVPEGASYIRETSRRRRIPFSTGSSSLRPIRRVR